MTFVMGIKECICRILVDGEKKKLDDLVDREEESKGGVGMRKPRLPAGVHSHG